MRTEEKFRKALEEIAAKDGMTNLADCCVGKTCTPYFAGGVQEARCIFQAGVARGFSTCAAIAKEGLAPEEVKPDPRQMELPGVHHFNGA